MFLRFHKKFVQPPTRRSISTLYWVTLPKHTDGESNAANDSLEVQEISKKEQGRMKAKRAREAVTQKRALEAGAASNSPADERDSKKTKSEP